MSNWKKEAIRWSKIDDQEEEDRIMGINQEENPDKYWERWTLDDCAKAVLGVLEQQKDEIGDDGEETGPIELMILFYKNLSKDYLRIGER